MKKIILLLLTAVICALHVSAQTKPKPKAKTAAKPSVGLAASIAAGKLVYLQNCLTCHMADGLGVQNMNPPLVKTTYVLGDKAKIIKIVLNGFSEKVEINGDNYTNVMPPLGATLSDDEIAHVLTYVRNSFGNKASLVTTAEVKKTRGM